MEVLGRLRIMSPRRSDIQSSPLPLSGVGVDGWLPTESGFSLAPQLEQASAWGGLSFPHIGQR
jgi:hypothetical protein